MGSQRSVTDTEIAAELEILRKENAELKSRLLETRSAPTETKHVHYWRKVSAVTLAVLAGVLLLTGSFFVWVARTVADTDQYIATVGPLVNEPAVQSAVADRAANAVFEQVDVEQLAREALPPRATFLAGPLESQVQSNTRSFLLQAVQSDTFETVWLATQREAHENLLALVKSDTAASGVLDINALYTSLNDDLASSRLSVLANRELPDRVGQIVIFESESLATAHFIVTNLSWLRLGAIAGFVVLTIAAVALVRDKRRFVVGLFVAYGLALLGMMVVLGAVQNATAQSVNPQYVAAFDAAWNTIFSSYTTQLVVLAVMAFLIAVVAWLGGGSRVAASGRNKVQAIFSGRLHESLFGESSPAWTLHIAKYRRVIRIVIVILALTFLIIEPVTASRLLWTSVVSLIIIGLIEVVAGKPESLSKTD